MSAESRNLPQTPRAYRQQARARSASATRERVLGAAEALLADGAPTSLDAVARRARTTVPTVLRHFGGRDALLAAALGAALERVHAERPRVTPGDALGAARVLGGEYEEHATLLRAAAGTPGRELEASHRLHRDWLARTFAGSLSPLPPLVHRRRLAQLVAVSGPEPWRALREAEHLGAAQATAALAELLRALTR